MADIYEGIKAPSPLVLDEDTRAKIVEYVTAEDETASEEREGLEERVAKWRRQREQEPEKAKKDSPWPNASNVVTPLAAIATNGNYAYLRAAFALRDPFWTIASPMEPGLSEDAEAITDFFRIQSKSPYHLDLNPALETILYTAASEGNCFVKIPWLTEHWQFKGIDPVTGSIVQVNKLMHDGPAIIPIPFEDFMTRAGVYDLQQAPWLRHRVYLTWHQMKQREANMIYANVSEVESDYTGRLPDIKEEDLRRAGFEPKENKLWDIREYNVFWDVDGDGIPEDFIITLHWDTKTVLREQYNDMGVRTYCNIPYEVRPYSLYKLGVGARAERLQDETDTHHNYRVDGMVLANLRMLLARRNCGLGPKEVLRPGKILFVDNPRDDVQVLQFGEVYPSSMQAEMLTRQYLERITGLSDYSIGFNDPNVRYPTTSGMMYLGQQGSTVKGSIIEAMQNEFARMGQLILFQYVRNNTRVNLELFDARRAASIRKALTMKIEDIPTRFQFIVKTTDINRTDEARRQNVLTLTQLYAVYFKDIMQTMMMAYQPQVPPDVKGLALRHFTGASRMMEKVLKFFGEDDTEKYLPDFRKAEMLLKAVDQMQGGMGGRQLPVAGGAMGAGGAPAGTVAGPVGEPGVGGVSPTAPVTAPTESGQGPQF